MRACVCVAHARVFVCWGGTCVCVFVLAPAPRSVKQLGLGVLHVMAAGGTDSGETLGHGRGREREAGPLADERQTGLPQWQQWAVH